MCCLGTPPPRVDSREQQTVVTWPPFSSGRGGGALAQASVRAAPWTPGWLFRQVSTGVKTCLLYGKGLGGDR